MRMSSEAMLMTNVWVLLRGKLSAWDCMPQPTKRLPTIEVCRTRPELAWPVPGRGRLSEEVPQVPHHALQHSRAVPEPAEVACDVTHEPLRTDKVSTEWARSS